MVYVDEDQVWYTSDTRPAAGPEHPRKDPHLFRFDVATGETTTMRPAELDAELSTRARMFVAEDNDLELNAPGFSEDASFRQVGRRLATVTPDGDLLTLTRTNGDEVGLQLPSGFTVLGQQIDASVISLSQWLDDDHIVVWANGGGGDLPAQEGDLLVCPLPDGICQRCRPQVVPPVRRPLTSAGSEPLALIRQRSEHADDRADAHKIFRPWCR